MPNDYAIRLWRQLIHPDGKSGFALPLGPTNHGNRSASNRKRMRMVRHLPKLSIAMSVTSLALMLAGPALAETVTIGIGTQDTTTNTVTAGTVVRQLHLLEKFLP